MAEHLETGADGEQLACRYLEGKGYRILERNWRSGQNELDIIATNKQFLVIVEVKTRRSSRARAIIRSGRIATCSTKSRTSTGLRV